MSEVAALATITGKPAAPAQSASWQTALKKLLDTPSIPRTQKAYGQAVTEAMEAKGIDVLADVRPPILADCRVVLVACLDADREGRPSPSTVNLKLGALRSFLHFCQVTGATPLSKDVIAFVLKSARAKVCKPYKVLSEPERERFFEAASERGPREYSLVSLVLSAGTRFRVALVVDISDHDAGLGQLGRDGRRARDRGVPGRYRCCCRRNGRNCRQRFVGHSRTASTCCALQDRRPARIASSHSPAPDEDQATLVDRIPPVTLVSQPTHLPERHISRCLGQGLLTSLPRFDSRPA